MLTDFGRFSRKLRIDNDELLKDMAGKLAVLPSYLSDVEHGKKRVPGKWLQKMPGLYEFSSAQMNEFATIFALTELTSKEKNALHAALSVLYLNDSSDYINGLWDVLRAILGNEILDNEGFDISSWLNQIRVDE